MSQIGEAGSVFNIGLDDLPARDARGLEARLNNTIRLARDIFVKTDWILDADRESSFSKMLGEQTNTEIVNISVKDYNTDVFDVDALFVVVISTEVIEHLMAPVVYLNECRKRLAPGGTFILTTPRGGWLPSNIFVNKYHYHEMNKHSLTQLLDYCGFTIIRIEYFNHELTHYLQNGFFRPVLRWLLRGTWFVEAREKEAK